MVAITDLGLLIALTRLSLRRPRWWLMAMTAIQLVEITGHLARVTQPGLTRLAYAILVGGGAYLQVILLSIGSTLDGRTRRSTAGHPA